MKWISIEDSLPKKNGKYLIYEPKVSALVQMAPWNMVFQFSQQWSKVTHWMPLPEPPTADIAKRKIKKYLDNYYPVQVQSGASIDDWTEIVYKCLKRIEEIE